MTTINVGLLKSNIEKLVNQRGESKTKVFINSGVGKDFFSNLNKGQIPSVEKIMSLADYLEVSTDYLLGRTTEKSLGTNYGIQNHSENNQGDITNQLNLQGDNGLHGKMLGEFDKLDFKDQVKVLNLIAELSEKGA